MALRGEQLSDHILMAAKNVFLELGFERASMDIIAARAETSKRTLYARFESKERLYLAVIELARGLLLGRVGRPADYSGTPEQVLVQFCTRYLLAMLYAPVIRMCRMSIDQAVRFPEGSARYYASIFTGVEEPLRDYLVNALGASPEHAAAAADALLGRVLYPRFQRALFGLDPLVEVLSDDPRASGVVMQPIHAAVRELLGSLAEKADASA